MSDLWHTMVACGLISGTQPITLMGMLVLLGGEHGRRNAGWYIFGGFCIQTTIVLISGYLLDGTVKPDSTPGHSLIALRIVAGVALVGLGIWFRKPARKEPPEVPKILDRLGDLSPFGSFIAGVAIADYTGSAMAAAALSTNDVTNTEALACWAIYASLATGLLVVALVAGMIWGSKLGVQFSLAILALKALPVVILGGFTSIPGAIVGGLMIGLGEKLSEVYLGPMIGGGIEIWFAYQLALLFLLFRPQGLFGEKIIDRV